MKVCTTDELLAVTQYTLAETLYSEKQYDEALKNATLALQYFKKDPNRLEFANKTYELIVKYTRKRILEQQM
ncbi:hypothetical protein BP422_06945 [Brevibacillus formosus]|uniref:Tetratricopeptide repeat protein n=1 Tax=Brevibacillus formosus TaxID=54913 RepID=A0A220ME76_9BACL|nr:hypothetical protein BP422_06945 [Brevibacillus formosus]